VIIQHCCKNYNENYYVQCCVLLCISILDLGLLSSYGYDCKSTQ